MNQTTPQVTQNIGELSGYGDENARLQALRSLDLLDTPPEGELNDLVQLAAEVCGTPISCVTLVDEVRVWVKAAVGVPTGESRRDVSLCSYTIQGNDLLIVENAEQDVRFSGNPHVTGDPRIRFYAGVPITTTAGYKIGTLCVIDIVPRTLRSSQAQALKVLASQVMVRMELRKQRRELETALAEKEVILSEKEKAEQGLKATEALFRTFMNHSPFASYIKDDLGRMLYYNELLAQRFGVTQEEWLGRTDAEIWPAELAAIFRKNDLAVLASGKTMEMIDNTMGADGEMISWKSIKFPYRDGGGKMLLAGISVDITDELRKKHELERANVLLQLLATSDGLTGLKNRRAFEERLQIEFTLAKRTGRDLSVLMIDIDNFKRRNDTWGHAAGDEVMRKLGAILNSTVRLTDTAARYGGEEFAVLLPDTDGEQAVALAQRLRTRIAGEEWEHSPVTLSFGVSTVDAFTIDMDQLMRAADSAMYAAKRAGKDCVLVSTRIEEDAFVSKKV
jgi:diguanylate cyclase (GGDEF)-like protein/PAS domain S-box-containing protein